MEQQSQHLESIIRTVCNRQTLKPSDRVLRKLKTKLWLSDFLSVNPRKLNIVYAALLLGGATTVITLYHSKENSTDNTTMEPISSSEAGKQGNVSDEKLTPANEVLQPASENTENKSESRLTALFSISAKKGCIPLTVQFTNHSAQFISWNWDFGNGKKSTVQNPVYTYTSAGHYTTSLTVKNSSGQQDTYLQEIEVLDKPVADFEIDIENSDINNKSLVFKNKSEGGNSYFWDFGDRQSRENDKSTHTYADYGTYKVQMVTTAANGCQDTATLVNKFIEKNFELSFPLTFRPNPVDRNNGFYDQAGVESSVFFPRNYGADKYEFNIFAPNGLKVFSTNTIKRGWNGYIGVRLAPTGTYSWTARGIYPNGKPFRLQGTVKVISQEFE